MDISPQDQIAVMQNENSTVALTENDELQEEHMRAAAEGRRNSGRRTKFAATNDER